MKLRMVFGIVLLGFLTLLCLPTIVWYIQEPVKLSIFVADKTVPREDFREHLGLFWVLEHVKVVDQQGKFYELEEDYYGYRPYDLKGDEKPEIKDPDVIYVADTYGVYSADVEQENLRGDRSKLLYGGLSIYEWNRIMAAKSPQTTLIMEFNSIASPTDRMVRRIVEDNLSFRWSGWIGRYFPNLQDREVPEWLKRNYERQTGLEWNFTGEGIAFINENDTVVILDTEDFDNVVKFEWTQVGQQHYPEAKNSHYGYWFDIIIPDEDAVIEAKYSLDLAESGSKKLQKNGIPQSMPAIIRHQGNRTYYFAGDYADIKTEYWSEWRLPSLYYTLVAFLERDEEFFWRSYIPMMKQLIQEIQGERNQ